MIQEYEEKYIEQVGVMINGYLGEKEYELALNALYMAKEELGNNSKIVSLIEDVKTESG